MHRSVHVVTSPAPVVSIPEAKAARVFPADVSDELIEALIDAATCEIDGPDGWLGRALGRQMLEMRLDDFDCIEIELMCPPVVDVNSVRFDGVGGLDQVLDPSRYSVVDRDRRPRLIRAFGTEWPAVRCAPESVRIRYEAGYETVPSAIKHAILLMAAELHMHGIGVGQIRSETVDGVGSIDYQVASADAVLAMRAAGERLLRTFRIY